MNNQGFPTPQAVPFQQQPQLQQQRPSFPTQPIISQGPPMPQQQLPQQQFQQAPPYQQTQFQQPFQPQQPQQQQYAYPNQPGTMPFQQGTNGNMATNILQGAATQLMMDPNAWQSIGNQAFQTGQQYLDKNVNRWINWPQWRYYWNVSNNYVVSKLQLVLFPFRNPNWSRMAMRSEINGHLEGYKPPRYDVNAPDLYIPIMAYITYIILVAISMGRESRFTPEVLSLTASTAMFFTAIEVLFLRLGMYLMSVNMNDSLINLADLLSYSGYQFISILVIKLIKFVIDDFWIVSLVAVYCAFSLAWFSLRSLRYIVFPSSDGANTVANNTVTPMRKRRVYFLFSFVILQFASVLFLSSR